MTTALYNIATHNGAITVENPASGNHRTLRVSTVLKGKLKGKRILQLLTGPDNTSNYTGFAFVNPDGTINVWHSKRGQGFRSEWERLADTIARPDHYQGLGAVYHFEGRCRVCNRPLTDPTSITLGIGPKCRGEG